MARPNSTVVVIAGDESARVVAGLDGLANVRAVPRTPDDDGRRVRVAVAQSHAAYVVHDTDPLAGVATVRDTIAGLRSGRWWPDPPDEWLHGLGRVVPDRAVLSSG